MAFDPDADWDDYEQDERGLVEPDEYEIDTARRLASLGRNYRSRPLRPEEERAWAKALAMIGNAFSPRKQEDAA